VKPVETVEARTIAKPEVAVSRQRPSLFGRAAVRRRVLLALSAVAVSAALAIPASAGAEYYWGCTYSWGSACFAPRSGGVNFLITQDPDHAGEWGGVKPENGYPPPKWDGRERDVCGGVWNSQVGQNVPWSCTWGQNVYTFPYVSGQGMIGTAVAYYKIGLYQVIDYGEYGP
jgi:hypothetical protein